MPIGGQRVVTVLMLYNRLSSIGIRDKIQAGATVRRSRWQTLTKIVLPGSVPR